MPDDIQAPDATGQMSSPQPDLGTGAATPQLAPQGGSGPRPILMDLIQGLIKPRMQASAPGQMATPVSRAQTFENFLGNFVYALGQGFANEGHGPGAGFRGAGAAATAPLDLQMAQQKQQAAVGLQGAQQQEAQAKAAQTQRQTELSGSMVTLPNGTQLPYDVAVKSGYLKGANAADINAKSRMSVEEMKFKIMQGQVAKVLDYKDPQTGELGKMAYNKMGVPMGMVPGALTSASYLPKSTSTVEFKEDKDGNIVALPKTSTSRPQLPGSLGGPAKFPQSGGGGTSRIPQAPASGGGPRVVMQGKSAGETGYAFNPQTQETEMTTRGAAASSGSQMFRKAGAKEIQDDTMLNNRLADVATKLTRYEDFAAPGNLSVGDKSNIARILQEDKFKVGAFGAEIPVDALNQFLKANRTYNLSDNGQKALVSYLNARESMTGYQRVLAGSARGGEKQMQLNLDALPTPVMDDRYIKEGLTQFLENVKLAGRGMPRMPGIQKADDILGDREPVRVQIPGQSEGTVRRGKLKDFQAKYPAAQILK